MPRTQHPQGVQMLLDADDELFIKHHSNIRNAEAAFSASVLKNMRILHLRLGHFSERKIHESIAAGAKFGPHAEHAQMTDKPHVCTGCLQGKAHKPHKQRHSERGLHPGDLIHCDLKEKVEKSDKGAEYWIHFTDDTTRYTDARPKSSEASCA